MSFSLFPAIFGNLTKQLKLIKGNIYHVEGYLHNIIIDFKVLLIICKPTCLAESKSSFKSHLSYHFHIPFYFILFNITEFVLIVILLVLSVCSLHELIYCWKVGLILLHFIRSVHFCNFLMKSSLGHYWYCILSWRQVWQNRHVCKDLVDTGKYRFVVFACGDSICEIRGQS